MESINSGCPAAATAPPPTYTRERDVNPALATYLAGKKSKAISGFKMVNSSPLRYAGGKSRAIGIILNALPALAGRKIVSPFLGGGSVEIELANLGYQVEAYDIFDMLVVFWKELLANPELLGSALEKLTPTNEAFTRNRHILLNYWEKVKPPELVYKTRNPLELTGAEKTLLDTSSLLQAAYYYYNMQLSYGPMFLGWPSSVYLNNAAKYQGIVRRIKEFRCPKLSVNKQDFLETIPANPDAFLYLDPPYYLGADSKMFKGIYPNTNFAIHHDTFPHEKLRNTLHNHKSGFIMTYNDCPTIREWYQDYIFEFPRWHYSYGQGETRVGNNRADAAQGKEHIKESHEIIIICPPQEQ